jgi:tetratricopeptide (TPR) repeat protein
VNRRWRLSVAAVALLLTATSAAAQSDARQRQAAAEAYDQGTAAYLSGDFEKAAQWFETANRLSPAAPALIQGARSHQKAGNLPRAATLALRLVTVYPDDASAAEIGNSLLAEIGPTLLRVDVQCDRECSLDLDGTLQEFPSFFLPPDVSHTVTASFESGERREQVSGSAGEARSLLFEAPPPTRASTRTPSDPDRGLAGGTKPETRDRDEDDDRKPLPPVVTFIGAGVTGVLLVASIWSSVDAYSSTGPYDEALAASNEECTRDEFSAECLALYDKTVELLEEGEGRDTRSTVLWVSTAVVGVATGAIALFLTDWSGDETQDGSRVSFGAAPLMGSSRGGIVRLAGRF